MLSLRRAMIADQCFSPIFPTNNQRGSSVVRAGTSTNWGSAMSTGSRLNGGASGRKRQPISTLTSTGSLPVVGA